MADPVQPAPVTLFSGPCDSSTPAALRRGLDAVASQLIPPSLLADLQVIASELASNSVRAGADWLAAELGILADHLELRVSDDAAGTPALGNPSPSATGGRGLRIVESIAESWGFRQDGVGKTVWARTRFR